MSEPIFILEEHLKGPVKKMVAVVDLIYEAEQNLQRQGTKLIPFSRDGVAELLFNAAHRLREGYERAHEEATGEEESE